MDQNPHGIESARSSFVLQLFIGLVTEETPVQVRRPRETTGLQTPLVRFFLFITAVQQKIFLLLALVAEVLFFDLHMIALELLQDPTALLRAVGGKFLLVAEVVDEDSRIGLDKEPDFFGYGEKWIKLPEKKTVQVQFASLDHMKFQKEALLENHLRQIKAFLRHHDGIVVPIITTMEERHLKAAGEALKILRGE